MGNIKTIRNPTARQLGWICIPVPIVFLVAVIFHWVSPWVMILQGIDITVYMIVFSYFCIKQKCYRQLGITWLYAAILLAGYLVISIDLIKFFAQQ